MKKACRPLLFALLISAVSLGLAQDRKPVPAIADATWAEYEREYQRSPLCTREEVTLWTCKAGKRTFSLCSSKAVTREAGYMQYRASTAGKIVLQYPQTKAPPLGLFTFHSFANGDASLEFEISGHHYSLVDPLRSASSILVATPRAAGKTSAIRCGANQTLQLNYTMRLMYESGIWAGR